MNRDDIRLVRNHLDSKCNDIKRICFLYRMFMFNCKHCKLFMSGDSNMRSRCLGSNRIHGYKRLFEGIK